MCTLRPSYKNTGNCSENYDFKNLKVVSTFDKKWCEPCYRCYCCNKILKPKEKVVEYDMRPCCKSCYDKVNI